MNNSFLLQYYFSGHYLHETFRRFVKADYLNQFEIDDLIECQEECEMNTSASVLGCNVVNSFG